MADFCWLFTVFWRIAPTHPTEHFLPTIEATNKTAIAPAASNTIPQWQPQYRISHDLSLKYVCSSPVICPLQLLRFFWHIHRRWPTVCYWLLSPPVLTMCPPRTKIPQSQKKQNEVICPRFFPKMWGSFFFQPHRCSIYIYIHIHIDIICI